MATWKSQPIFVSSTFADMQAERDHLRSVVFPALEERLWARRSHVEWVDLRLGVATASLAEGEARELQVLKVCLAEVRRCRSTLVITNIPSSACRPCRRPQAKRALEHQDRKVPALPQVDEFSNSQPQIQALAIELTDATREALTASKSAHTLRCYRSHWQLWEAYATQVSATALPAAPVHVENWCTARAEAGQALTTIRTGLAAEIAFPAY